MTTTGLDALSDVLTGLQEGDQPREVLAVVKRDIEEVRRGWPAAVVAQDRSLGESILRRLPGAACLPPFDEVVEWLADDRDSLERASIVVATTTARQLLPRTLTEALEVAAAAGAPILLIVLAMGRVRDPASAEATYVRQVASALPGARVNLVCLGDERHAGPSFDEAVAQVSALRRPIDRMNSLAALRAGQAAALIADRAEIVRRDLASASETASLLRALEQGGLVLATAEVRGWQQHLQALLVPLRAINVADVVATARAGASGAAVVKQAILELRARCENGIKKASKEVEEKLIADLERLVSAIARDFVRALESLRSLDVEVDAPTPNLGSLRDRLRPNLAEIAGKTLAGIEMPDQLLAMADLIAGGRAGPAEEPRTETPDAAPTSQGGPSKEEAEAPSQSDAGPTSNGGGDDEANEPSSDDRTPLDPKWQRLAEILANVPERLIVARLHGALEEAVSEALVRCDHAMDATCATWSVEVEERIESGFMPLHRFSEAHRLRLSGRLDALTRTLRELERFDAVR